MPASLSIYRVVARQWHRRPYDGAHAELRVELARPGACTTLSYIRIYMGQVFFRTASPLIAYGIPWAPHGAALRRHCDTQPGPARGPRRSNTMLVSIAGGQVTHGCSTGVNPLVSVDNKPNSASACKDHDRAAGPTGGNIINMISMYSYSGTVDMTV